MKSDENEIENPRVNPCERNLSCEEIAPGRKNAGKHDVNMILKIVA
jgi:hypothetical protein